MITIPSLVQAQNSNTTTTNTTSNYNKTTKCRYNDDGWKLSPEKIALASGRDAP